jgi:hypothetical protein
MRGWQRLEGKGQPDTLFEAARIDHATHPEARQIMMLHPIPRRASVAVLTLSIALGSVAPVAFADEADRARAEQLFVDAKQLMEQGKYAEACPKLEVPTHLEPFDGCARKGDMDDVRGHREGT